jgi:hypothetical protein
MTISPPEREEKKQGLLSIKTRFPPHLRNGLNQVTSTAP